MISALEILLLYSKKMLNNKRVRLTKISKKKPFLLRLYEILNEKENQEIIHWNSEGNGLIIENINMLSIIILPKYYNHNNYSSFVRQLNIYRFHKTKSKVKEKEEYKHEIFNKKITKEQVKKINKRRNKEMEKNIMNIDNNDLGNDSLSFNTGEDIFKYILMKNEENKKSIVELKSKAWDLRNQNNILKNLIQKIINNFNGHNILFEKMLKYDGKNKTNEMKKIKKSKNIYEFFKKYLYHLKIYSPYVKLNNDNTYNIEKIESFTLGQSEKEIFNNNINNINTIHVNNDAFLEECPFISQRQHIKSFDLINFNNTTNSIFNNYNEY